MREKSHGKYGDANSEGFGNNGTGAVGGRGRASRPVPDYPAPIPSDTKTPTMICRRG